MVGHRISFSDNLQKLKFSIRFCAPWILKIHLFILTGPFLFNGPPLRS